MRTISAAIACVFIYTLFFVVILFLFRPHQLMGVKRKLILVACLAYFLDTTYRLVLQVLEISHSKLSTLQKSPLYVMFFMGVCWQAYILTNHLLHQERTRREQMALFLQFTGRKIRFKQICNWSKYDVNLGLQIWPKFALEAMLMQTQIFIPVVFARKCEVNMISTLLLLRFCYLRKSTNLTYIYTY